MKKIFIVILVTLISGIFLLLVLFPSLLYLLVPPTNLWAVIYCPIVSEKTGHCPETFCVFTCVGGGGGSEFGCFDGCKPKIISNF